MIGDDRDGQARGEDPLLMALGELIRREVSASELLRHVVDVMADLLGAERGTLFLLDRVRRELVSVAAHLPELDEIRLPLTRGVAGFVARTGESVTIRDCEGDERFSAAVDKQTGYVTQNMLAIPLESADGQLIGVVQVLNKKGGVFDEEDRRRLQGLARQAAGLLEKTTLTPSQSDGEERSVLLDGEGINQVVGRGGAMRAIIADVRRVAPLDATVLLRGESGTGKSLFARAVHHNSRRREGPLIQVDCTTFPEGLMESELFGHERGAFTGAYERKAGKVEAAEGGSLFLDEIGDLPPVLQGKLLTLLQDCTYCPVGGSGRRQADIRIIAATNRNLEELVATGAFREDLYYRLRVVEIVLPTLRDRGRQDLKELIEYFISRAAERHGRSRPRVREDAMEMLLGYHWPGNVRELQNCLESAVIFADERITPSKLSLPHPDATRKVRALKRESRRRRDWFGDEPTLSQLEARYIGYLLDRYEGNRSACARILEIGRNTLLRKIREYGLE